MKIGKLFLLFSSFAVAGCSPLLIDTSMKTSSSSTRPSIVIPTGSTTYIPHTEPDPFPEDEDEDIDISDFTLDNIPVNFTAINDYHGQIDEDINDYRAGLAKTSTYLKERKSKGDVLISSGDMYQGSFLCNIDKGQFLSYAFKNIGFDAYVLGNHEFDWGIAPILDNEAALEERFLGANIYQYPKQNNQWVKSDLGQEYKIIDLYEGTDFEVRVGVIGVNGKKQITSITSSNVPDYIFLDPTSIVKNISTKLRKEYNCDFIVASYHEDEPSTSIANIDPNTNQHYVDLCLKAQTHQYQHEINNGVPFIQASAYSRGVSMAKFSFNKITHTITLKDSGYVYLSSLDLTPDPIMVAAIEEQKDKNIDKFTTIIGSNNTGNDLDVGEMSQFYAKITYDKATLENPDYNIEGCMFNDSRQPLKTGEFTYSELFETHPFLNNIYLLSVSEKDISNEIKYTYGYINPESSIGSSSSVYHDILVFDYNGLHINIDSNLNKYYDYFPSAFSSYAAHEPIKLDFNCFDAALDWLKYNPVIEEEHITGPGFYYRNR